MHYVQVEAKETKRDDCGNAAFKHFQQEFPSLLWLPNVVSSRVGAIFASVLA